MKKRKQTKAELRKKKVRAGLIGGKRRALMLSPERRREIARKAALVKHAKHHTPEARAARIAALEEELARERAATPQERGELP